MSARPAASFRSPWRFSLHGLMVVMAGVGFLVWSFTWAKDSDEKVVLSLWAIGIACVLVFCHVKSRWGLRISCALTTLFPAIGYLRCGVLAGMTGRFAYLAVAAAWIVLACGVATVCVVGAYWLFDWFNRKADWRWQMGSIVGSVALCAGAIVGGQQLLRTDDTWLPMRVISDLPFINPNQDGYPPLTLSNDGTVLAVGEPSVRGAKQPEAWLQIWQLGVDGSKPFRMKTPPARTLCLSPNGKQIAVVHSGISIYDTSNGALVKHLIVPSANLWVQQPCRFSPDGRSFVFCTSDYDLQKAFVWSTCDWTLQLEQDVREVVMPNVHCGNLALLTFTPGGSGGEMVLRDLNKLKPLVKAQHVNQVYQPVSSPDGIQVAYGDHLLDWRSGNISILPAPIHAFVNKGEWFVSRRADMTALRPNPFPGWRYALPFVRQWCRFNDGGQAILIDIASGKEVASSPNYEREAFLSFHASEDGRTVVGATFSSKFYVWRLPDASEGSEIVKRAP